MDEKWTLGILGLYTLIYLVVFFIQKSQIDKQKNLINSMKSFIEIFKVSDVKEYVDLKVESANLKARNLLDNDEKLKSTIMDIGTDMAKDMENKFSKFYFEKMGEKHLELLKVVMQLIINQKPERRGEFIEDLLPKNAHYLLPLIDEHERNNP